MPQTLVNPWMRTDPVADVTGGYLTLNSGSMLSMNSTVSGGTLYLLPVVHRYYRLNDGNRWGIYDIGSGGISVAVVLATNTQGEVYLKAVSGTPTLFIETGTTVVRVDGVPVKSGDVTKRHIGTVYGWTSANTIMWRPRADSATVGHPHLGIWNRYNQRQLIAEQSDSTDSWAYALTPWRQVRGAWQLQFVVDPINETLVEADMYVDSAVQTGGHCPFNAISDTSTSLDGFGTVLRQQDSNGASGPGRQTGIANYRRSWSGGFKILYPLEKISSANSITFYGDDGATGVRSVAYVKYLG